LLKTKYFKFNEDMQIFKDVRLLDEKGKVIGMYTLVEAKKKA
jgi:translation initiation factor IF-3